jgi:hypothetical protein
MDWYISQQKMATNEAAPVPFSFEREKYYMGRMDAVLFHERIKRSVELSQAMDFIASDEPGTKVKVSSGEMIDFFPSREFHITVEKQKVLESGTVKPENADLITDKVSFKINKNYLVKSEIAILNMIAANNWERPVYIDHSLLHTGHIFFLDYLQFEGLAYRFVPIKTESNGMNRGRVDVDILYNNVMKKFVWGNVNDPDVFLDDYNKKEIKIIQARYLFARLAQELIQNGDNTKAIEVLDKMFELFPDSKMPLTYDSFPAASLYYQVGEAEKGNDIIRIMAHNSFEMLEYYISLPTRFVNSIQGEQSREMSHLQNLLIITRQNNQQELNKEIDDRLKGLVDRLESEIGS